jgi:NAD(P)H-nitrite reductase large subunit
VSELRTYVVIGNGIAGTGCAETLRKADPSARITIVAAEPYPLYNRIALPPYLKRKVAEKKVIIRDLAWHERMNIELLRETVVASVHPDEHAVTLQDSRVLPYDALLIATGSRANAHPCGCCRGVYNFQTLDDARGIDARLEQARAAVAVGGSYISYELCEAFSQRGMATTWLMRGPWFLRRVLEEEGGALVDRIAVEHGVTVVHGEEVDGFETSPDGELTAVVTDRGRRIEAELAGVGVGVRRNVEFLAGSGVETRTGVVTDEKLRTSAPDVYAAGDCAEFFDPYWGTHNVMGTWDNAVDQGRLAARNMMGGDESFDEVPAYATTLFDSRIVSFGANLEVDPDLESHYRIDQVERTYRRLFFRGEKLVGGVIIGDKKGRQKLVEMIRERVDIPREERRALLELQ